MVWSFWMEATTMSMAIAEKILMSGWTLCGQSRRWRILRMLLQKRILRTGIIMKQIMRNMQVNLMSWIRNFGTA